MPLRRANILFKDRLAGELEETPQGGTVFTYLADWPGSIACALPIEQKRVTWRHGLHPVFQNLGAEGWLREKQARAGHIEPEDDFGLLLRYGADCIGAISLQTSTNAEELPKVRFDDEAADAAIAARRTMSGVQRKILVWRDDGHFRPATFDTPATHIAKYAPSPDVDPSLLRNEIFSLALARDILGDIEVTKFQTGQVDGIDERALLVERFDRTPSGLKLRLEDFAQILSRPRGNDFKGKYEGSYEEVAEAISRHSSRPLIDLPRFFSALVFNLIIGNADAHLKNWSLLEDPSGLRLSPQYDLLNTLLYGGAYDTKAALALGGDKVSIESVDGPRVVRFGEQIGLRGGVIARRLGALKRAFSRTSRLTPSPGEPPDGFVHRYRDIVRSACARILET